MNTIKYISGLLSFLAIIVLVTSCSAVNAEDKESKEKKGISGLRIMKMATKKRIYRKFKTKKIVVSLFSDDVFNGCSIK